MKKYLILISMGLLFTVNSAAAGIIGTVKTKIIGVNSYAELNNGDVVIYVQDNPVACPGGFWIDGTNTAIGARNTLSTALSAFYTGTPVYVNGYDDETRKWPGSSTFTCKLYNVQLTN